MFALRLRKVLVITALWTVLSVIQVLYDELVRRSFGASLPFYSFGRSLALNPIAALVGGPIAASIVIFGIKERLRRWPLWQVVAAHAITYVGITAVLTYTGNLAYFAIQGGRSLLDPETIQATHAWYFGPWTIRNLLFWTVVATLTSFMVEVFDILGPGFWKDFVLARYQRPRVERRTFMFLDLEGSTSIAEAMGAAGYYEFLAECYRDIAEPIVQSRGQIYQYVGDEVVVTWPGREGLTHGRCLDCYFGLVETVEARRAHYLERYGHAPTFRASFHHGEVTTGEVGYLARDIVFTGDVLNTAARMQEQCKVFGERALASQAVVDGLGPHGSTLGPVGTVTMRGKEEPTTLYAVRPRDTGLPAARSAD